MLPACEREHSEEPQPLPGAADETLQEIPFLSDTLLIEGQPHVVHLVRYDEPEIPFQTFFPEGDFVPAAIESDRGVHVRFVISTGGALNEEAFISFFFPDDASISDVQTQLDERASRENWRVVDAGDRMLPAEVPWAVRRVDYQVSPHHEWHFGTAFIGEQRGRAFLIRMQYPREYAEGFVPRAQKVLRHFRVK